MICTILECEVQEDRWKALQEKYEAIDKSELPQGLLGSHLVQDQANLKLWRILTFWKSQEDMDRYRKSVETPRWILLLRSVGAEPKLILNKVISSK